MWISYAEDNQRGNYGIKKQIKKPGMNLAQFNREVQENIYLNKRINAFN